MIRLAMDVRAVVVAALIGVCAPSWASACTPSTDQNEISKIYYRSVTSVYRAEARDFVPVNPKYPGDDFTVVLQPTDLIWGERQDQPVTLEFMSGECNNWFLFSDDESSLNDKSYFVFVAPQATEDLHQLSVMPAGDQPNAAALVMLGRLQEAGAGPPPLPLPDLRPMPVWPPAEVVDEARLLPAPWAFASAWLWLSGSAVVVLLIGIGVGRMSRPRRKGPSSS